MGSPAMPARVLFAALGLQLQACVAAAAAPAEGVRPHIVMHLVDDWGWANAGWHANEANAKEVRTPRMDRLVARGIELDRAYSYQFCSPTRSSLQSGRYPSHVNDKNMDVTVHNPLDPVSGFAAIPRNMTGIASKLRLAGYKTHQVGKWDAGMATWDHTPAGRGYDTSLGYFHHDNDYFTDSIGHGCRLGEEPGGGPFYNGSANCVIDLWDTKAPAFGLNSSCDAYYGGRKPGENPLGNCEQPGSNPSYSVGPEMIYEERVFVDRCLQIVDEHPKASPLFLNYDSHIVHSPLQAPAPLYHSLDFMENDWDKHRQLYASMVAYLDAGVGRIVDALVAQDMWNRTIWFCQSDNGGPSFTGDNHTANNFPLRGAKYSNWEGGVRVNAFVSGGWLDTVAPKRVGSKLEGFIHVCDYYAIFASLAGVDKHDERAALAKLPAVDGIDLWPYLAGHVQESPRQEVWNDLGVLIMGKYKLYNASGPYGKLNPDGSMSEGHACRPGPLYPNASSNPGGAGSGAACPKHGPCHSVNGTGLCVETQECPGGACLYDIFADPTEHHQLSGQAAMQAQIAKMRARLAELEATYFNPKRGHDDGTAQRVAREKWGSYWGPFIFP